MLLGVLLGVLLGMQRRRLAFIRLFGSVDGLLYKMVPSWAADCLV